MRLYETGFLISPNLSEEETESIILQMADVVSQKNGKMLKQEKWGKRRLAYTIKKFGEAYYVFFHYEGGPEIPLELGRRFRQMDTILRYLTLKRESKEDIRKKKKGVVKPREREVFLEEEHVEETNPKEEVASSKARERKDK